MSRRARALACGLFWLSSSGCRPVPPGTALPDEPDARGPSRSYVVLIKDGVAGKFTRTQVHEREFELNYQYSDRGRGAQLRTHVSLDAQGRLRGLHTTGHDDGGHPIDERFRRESSQSQWQNRGEQGEAAAADEKFYVSMDPVPGETARLVRRLLTRADRTLELLPSGVARLEELGGLRVEQAGQVRELRHFSVSGLGFSPTRVWLDSEGEFFAQLSAWISVIDEDWQASLETLRQADSAVDRQRSLALAQTLNTGPAVATAFVDVAVFDAQWAVLKPHQTVLVQGTNIIEVGAVADITPPRGARIIDGRGKTLLPGLWDMHVHLHGDDPLLHLAAGVTNVRDLANRADSLAEYKQQHAAGQRIGPRVWPAGIIEGKGPLAAPTTVRVDTPQSAIAAVDDYAARGYRQIKIYSSLAPKLVPVIAEHAHARGLRVSGHVPGGLRARDAIAAGFDELQHINFIALNCIPGQYDTRTPARFLVVAQRASDIDQACLGQLIADMVTRGTVVDPTVTIFESMFTNLAGQIAPAYASIAPSLPLSEARALLAGGLALPQTEPQRGASITRYRGAFKILLDIIARLDRAGVQLVAGSDALAGFTLQRELQNYVAAGLSPARVLQLATRDAANVVGVGDRLGGVRPGMLADLTLVEGDPVADIRNASRVVLSMVDGRSYDSAQLRAYLGMGN